MNIEDKKDKKPLKCGGMRKITISSENSATEEKSHEVDGQIALYPYEDNKETYLDLLLTDGLKTFVGRLVFDESFYSCIMSFVSLLFSYTLTLF